MVFHAYCGEERSGEAACHSSLGRHEDRQLPAQIQLPHPDTRWGGRWGGRQTSALPSSRIGATVSSLLEQAGKGSEKGLLGTPQQGMGVRRSLGKAGLARLFPKGLYFIGKT